MFLFCFFLSWSLSYPAYVSWSSRQCQAWALSLNMGLKLDKLLVVHSHKFCASIVPAGNLCRPEKWDILCLGWYTSSTTKSFSWFQQVAGSGSLLCGLKDYHAGELSFLEIDMPDKFKVTNTGVSDSWESQRCQNRA